MFGYVCRYAVHCNSTVPQEQRAGYIALGERNEAQAQAARGRRLKQILMMIIEAETIPYRTSMKTGSPAMKKMK